MQATEHNLCIMVENKSIQNVAMLKCSAMMVTNQYSIHQKINSSLSSGKAYYHTVQNVML